MGAPAAGARDRAGGAAGRRGQPRRGRVAAAGRDRGSRGRRLPGARGAAPQPAAAADAPARDPARGRARRAGDGCALVVVAPATTRRAAGSCSTTAGAPSRAAGRPRRGSRAAPLVVAATAAARVQGVDAAWLGACSWCRRRADRGGGRRARRRDVRVLARRGHRLRRGGGADRVRRARGRAAVRARPGLVAARRRRPRAPACAGRATPCCSSSGRARAARPRGARGHPQLAPRRSGTPPARCGIPEPGAPPAGPRAARARHAGSPASTSAGSWPARTSPTTRPSTPTRAPRTGRSTSRSAPSTRSTPSYRIQSFFRSSTGSENEQQPKPRNSSRRSRRSPRRRTRGRRRGTRRR